LNRIPRTITAVVDDGRATTWRVTLPQPWPASDASALMAHATVTWRQLSSLAYVDHLASDPQHAVTSWWRVQAPDRAAYTTSTGAAGIVIGGERWDRAARGAPWVQSPQTARITQPSPFWVSVADAHVVSRARLAGHPVAVVSFFDPRTPGWYLVTVQTDTYRTVDVRMNATAHFMHDRYGAFDAAAPIVPPR
jgi:hypothetical protein